jgi:hypothetical protein
MNLGVDAGEGRDQNGLLGQRYADQEMLRLNEMLLNHVWVDVEKPYAINIVALGI